MKRKVNYLMGALKRKYKTGRTDQEPGTFIKLSKQKAPLDETESGTSAKEKVAIMGMI